MGYGESESLHEEIEKLKFHNRTLLALLGDVMEDKMREPTIHEAIVVHDLSKTELQQFTQLIRGYNGDINAFKQQAASMGPKFTNLTVTGLMQGFAGSGILSGKCEEILQSYENN
ncbi:MULTISPECIES: hypothetical protein [unclassified Planococcus (in: firmicutes)]|uniref:hypothetical protein n=1 Tax=unclassified Planococcus (in: firmicutes) TaxID=2662419 RepID=UPI000C7D9B65|nr:MULTISPECIES: hypothetical protein [unclassified Planococcus (in: firmicutes)]PKG45585.1 hypothetical protein CXF66_10155 [Planococcus sp. Urea-trap-24]PKG88706.1 hypothetical protein CXF91_12065 [Planococcus sp. Urea-3u-39]PKH38576.1 hypothetical protein CXF77_10750 [Planococcus sp. MB-3u-09]